MIKKLNPPSRLVAFTPFPKQFVSKWLRYLSHPEILVYVYILEHTWGFNEYDVSKKITNDEFINGRKKKDGTRVDGGTGLSRPSVTKAVRMLVERGLIECVVDVSDRARVRRSFRLIQDDNPGGNDVTLEGNDVTLEGNDVTLEGNDVTLEGNDISLDQRDKLIREKLKERNVASPADLATSSHSSKSTSKNGSNESHSRFDEKALDHFLETMRIADVKIPVMKGSAKYKQWLNQFRLLRTRDLANKAAKQQGLTPQDIRKVLEWYRDYYPERRGTEGTWRAECGSTFRRKFFGMLNTMNSDKYRPKIINGIQLLTAKDVAKGQQRESGFGLETTPFRDWDFDYKAFRSSSDLDQRKMIADHVNMCIEEDEDTSGIIEVLRHVGLGYLVKHEN